MPVSKTEGGKSYPAASYLVVGDPQSPSTWALRVKDENGKPDHRLLGAAWAALHSGYRGNKYEGPDKAKAIAALKKIYSAEEMVTPSEETSKEGDNSMTVNLQEHATLKARALGLSKALKELLDEKTLPRVIRRQMENLRTSLKKTWKDLENEAGWDKETAQEDGGEMSVKGGPFEGVSSFADLKAARVATEYVNDIQSLACDFSMLVNNVLENDEIPAKAEAILALAEEFVSELAALQPAAEGEGEGEGMMTEGQADATDAGEPLAETAAQAEDKLEPQAEPVIEAQEQPAKVEILVEDGTPLMPVNIAEHAKILEVTPISDSSNRRGPIKVKVAFIQEGWGNERDGHYYPGSTLDESTPLFKDAKMYLTDHVQSEKSVRTEASFIETMHGFSPLQGLTGTVVVYDPDYAEKTRNLADVGRLDLMECSIYAEGETQTARIGEREGKIVKRITRVHSVDWVTRAGAGGHAVALAEAAAPNTTEGKNMDKEKVVELLAQTRLPKPLQAVLAEREYVDEKAVTDSVAAFIESWKAETGGGEPFAQGNAQPPQRGRTLEEHAAAVNDLYKRAGILS